MLLKNRNLHFEKCSHLVLFLKYIWTARGAWASFKEASNSLKHSLLIQIGALKRFFGGGAGTFSLLCPFSVQHRFQRCFLTASEKASEQRGEVSFRCEGLNLRLSVFFTEENSGPDCSRVTSNWVATGRERGEEGLWRHSVGQGRYV